MEIEPLHARIKDLVENNSELKSRTETQADEILRLKAQLADAEAKNLEYQDLVTEHEILLNTQKNELNEKTEILELLQTELDTSKNEIGMLQNDLEGIQIQRDIYNTLDQSELSQISHIENLCKPGISNQQLMFIKNM